MSQQMTLGAALGGTRSLVTQSLMVLAGTALVAAAAQVNVWMIPVPMTLQTLAISLIGLTYGARLAGITLIAYLLEGALGLPVFAGFSSGAKLIGPTGGFLFGFVVMAWLTGVLAENGFGRGAVRLFIAALVPTMLLYLPGVLWPYLATNLFADQLGAEAWGADTFAMLWQYYMQPFLIGDTVKSAIAALIVAGGWMAVGPRS